MTRHIRITAYAASLALPFAVSAQFGGGANDITGVFQIVLRFLNMLVPIFISIAVIAFLWGVLRYVNAGGDTEKIAEARDVMIYGVIAIFVMVSVWGLVNILLYTIFGGYVPTEPDQVPRLPT